jgi:sulfide:quinone oxidoreductase
MVDSPQQVVVVGSSFAGLTAALELRKHLDEHHRIVILDKRADFTFIPSLAFERMFLTTRKRGRVML